MDQSKYGVKGNEYEGIYFSEYEIPNTVFIEHIRVEISRQNSNLLEIKKKMVEKVKEKGGSAIGKFQYGQRKHRPLELVFSFKWDTESWYGEGDIVK